MRHAARLGREAVASALARPLTSALTVLMIAGTVAAVMLTTGRTVGAEHQVLATIDDAGTRSIVVRADSEAGLTSAVLTNVGAIDDVEWAAGFSSAVDGTNGLVPDGVRVPVRLAYGSQLERLGIPSRSPLPGRLAYGSSQALEALGLADGVGTVAVLGDDDYTVAGRIEVPDFLTSFQPLLLVPQTEGTTPAPINVLVVIATRPEAVAAVAEAVRAMLAVDDPGRVTVQTSESLATLRDLVQAQLGAYGRGLVAAIFALTAVLEALVLYSLAVLRRKEFGRRRALGATRGLVIGLLLAQTAVLAAVGAGVGLCTALLVLRFSGSPIPGAPFVVATAVLAVATAAVAAALPAVAASRRDPLRELRVP